MEIEVLYFSLLNMSSSNWNLILCFAKSKNHFLILFCSYGQLVPIIVTMWPSLSLSTFLTGSLLFIPSFVATDNVADSVLLRADTHSHFCFTKYCRSQLLWAIMQWCCKMNFYIQKKLTLKLMNGVFNLSHKLGWFWYFICSSMPCYGVWEWRADWRWLQAPTSVLGWIFPASFALVLVRPGHSEISDLAFPENFCFPLCFRE